MLLKHVFTIGVVHAVALCSFSLLSVFAASCGKSNNSTNPSGGGGGDNPPPETANSLAASSPSSCSKSKANFCFYEQLPNQNAQASKITFTPSKGSVSDLTFAFPIGTVKSRFHRATSTMRAALEADAREPQLAGGRSA